MYYSYSTIITHCRLTAYTLHTHTLANRLIWQARTHARTLVCLITHITYWTLQECISSRDIERTSSHRLTTKMTYTILFISLLLQEWVRKRMKKKKKKRWRESTISSSAIRPLRTTHTHTHTSDWRMKMKTKKVSIFDLIAWIHIILLLLLLLLLFRGGQITKRIGWLIALRTRQ